ncbi:LysR family transcriptional regulator [Comamonadaceae bacterium G21597-S1]|nr:LysR family transcriptional regulator [Comamonadaceae bacterium G21597-S1]
MKLRSTVVLNRLLSKLRIRHLQMVIRLAELGHVGRTAQSLNMTQPAVTLLLADLERLVEAPLFVRHARGVSPTPLALEMLPLVRQVLARLEDSATLIASHLEYDEHLVRAAATAAGADGLLADSLPAFSRAHPQIEVVVTNADRAELAATVAREAIDVVFCRQPALVPVGWRFTACVDDAFAVVCGIRHPLARVGAPDPALLAQSEWLPNTLGSVARARFEDLCREQGWTPRIRPVTTRVTALTWTMLDTQDLLTLVPLGVVRPWVRRGLLHVVPTPWHLPLDPLGMLLPDAPLAPAVDKLAQHMIAHHDPAQRTNGSALPATRRR